MTLDDRSLREHLDRRAEAGASDVEQIAEVVMTRLAATGSGPWWRRLGVRGPSLGVAAAGIAVLVLALAVLPPSLWNGPGSSPTPSASSAVVGYPASRAMTLGELDDFLGADPSERAGQVVIADVELTKRALVCDSAYCPDLEIRFADRTATVMNWDRFVSLPFDPPFAFRVLPEGDLELLDPVRTGPNALGWTLPQLVDGLPEIRESAEQELYLVDAWRAVSAAQYRCLAGSSGVFGCGSGVAWLVARGAAGPSTSAPPGSLRIPNVSGDSPSDNTPQHGYWLVDPFVAQEECFLCPPAGAVDLLGRVLTFDELAFTPSETTEPSTDHTYPADRALTVLELDEVLGPDPAARAGVTVIADVTLEPIFAVCDGVCPRYYAVLEGRRIAVYDPGTAEPELPGSSVLRIREDGALDLLGHARAGPDGLAWTLPQITAELATLRGPGVLPVHYLYLVVGWHAVAPFQPSCAPATGDPRFGCGDLEAWLVPDEATVRGLSTGLVSTPDTGIRVPNGGESGGAEAGFWLVDPWVDQSGCTRCPPGGAADLIGRILTLEELGVLP
jgi:hypothetical protein